MTQNTAQRELQALLDMERDARQQAEHARSLSESFNPMSAIDADGDGEASFALPEALATAVTTSFVLGPVGGAILGIAQGFLGKSERQSILDNFNAQDNALTEAYGVLSDRLQQARATAAPEDAARIETLITRAEMGAAYMQSPNLAQDSIAMFNEVGEALNTYEVDVETRAIEAANLKAAGKRQFEDWQQDTYTNLKANFDAKTSWYPTMMSSANDVLELLKQGSPSDVAVGLTRLAQTVSPGEAVQEGDRKILESLGGWADKLVSFAETAATGTLTTKNTREIMDTVFQLKEGGNKLATWYESQALNEFDDMLYDGQPIDNRFRDNFRITGNIPAASFGRADVPTLPLEDIKSKTEQAAREAVADQKAGNTPAQIAERMKINPPRGPVGQAVDSVLDTLTGGPEREVKSADELPDFPGLRPWE